MREDISIKKIGNICDVIPGQSPKSKFYNGEGEGLPFYQGKKRFTDKFLDTPVKWTTNITKEAVEGDILMSVRAPVGPVNFATQKICIGRGLAAIRPKENVDRDYLFYFFLKNEADLESTSGAVFDSINSKQIRNIKIPIPPLPEQKRIVAILDEAFEAIDKAKANVEQNIENAEELFQSKLNEIFLEIRYKSEIQAMGEVMDVRDGTHDSPNYIENGYPLITSKNLKNGELNYDKVKYISEKDYLNINRRSKVHIGDVLFAMIGTIGNPVVITNKPDYAIKNVALFKTGENISGDYLRYYLESKYVKDKMKLESKGTTQKFVGLRYLRSFPIPVPSMKTQRLISDKISEIESYYLELKEVYENKDYAVEELKKSILQKAFSGELTANEHVAV